MDLISLLPVRSAVDSLRGLARFELGGQEYVLPTLPIEDNERWLARIDAQLADLLRSVSAASENLPQILGMLTSQTPTLLDLLKAYDPGNLLGSVAEIRAKTRPHELLLAILMVWRAANPLVDMALMGMSAQMSGLSTALTSLPRQPGAGGPATSAAASAPSNSPASSTPRPTALHPIGSKRSKRPAPAPSSPTTSAVTADGAAVRPRRGVTAR